MKKKIEDLTKWLDDEFAKRYKEIELKDGRRRFYTPSKCVFRVDHFDNAIVIEYAETLKEADQNMYEDGDAYDVTDNSNEEMLQTFINEIENED